jgi:hypothetical protein
MAAVAANKYREGKYTDALRNTDRDSKRVSLCWHCGSMEYPKGGFCLTWGVKPILALKSQTQDYVAEKEVVAELIHDFCG